MHLTRPSVVTLIIKIMYFWHANHAWEYAFSANNLFAVILSCSQSDLSCHLLPGQLMMLIIVLINSWSID